VITNCGVFQSKSEYATTQGFSTEVASIKPEIQSNSTSVSVQFNSNNAFKSIREQRRETSERKRESSQLLQVHVQIVQQRRKLRGLWRDMLLK